VVCESRIVFARNSKTDAIKLTAGRQENTPHSKGYYSFDNYITTPRGIDEFGYEKITKLTADYALPLFYPDINIPYLLYIKRIRADIFYDFAQINNGTDVSNLKTAGLEINFDFNILRLNYFTFNIGVRISRIIKEKKYDYQFLFLGMEF